MQRRKGAQAEREVVRIIRSYGFDSHRTAALQSGHVAGLGIIGADVDGIPGAHVEVKRQETLAIGQWCEQAEADAPAEQTPVVVFRRTRQPWRVCLPLADYLRLHAEVFAHDPHAWKYEEALHLIATPIRSDGTYNRSREACEQVARDALGLGGP